MKIIILPIIVAYISLVVVLMAVMNILIKYPGKQLPLRRILSCLSGYSNNIRGDIIYQDGIYNCGKACIKMVLNKYNVNYKESDLKSEKSDGFSMLEISNIFRQHNVRSKGYEFHNIEQMETYLEKQKNYILLLLLKTNVTTFNNVLSIILLPVNLSVKLYTKHFKKNKTHYHWVILNKIYDSEINIDDPFYGNINVSKDDLSRIWSKYALYIYNN